jgi:hypothetical protein
VRQFVDPDTGEIFYEEQILRRPDENVKEFRPAGRSAKFVKIKASQKAKRRLRKLSLAEVGFSGEGEFFSKQKIKNIRNSTPSHSYPIRITERGRQTWTRRT